LSRWAERKGFQKTLEGVPQGGSISPLLTNIALHGMQQPIEEQFPRDKANRIRNTKRLFGKEVKDPTLIRYADDLVVICKGLTYCGTTMSADYIRMSRGIRAIIETGKPSNISESRRT
jgi:hypothetical protein